MLRASISVLIFISSLILQSCGSSIPHIEAQGQLAGQTINTTVDSQIARYYLEHYLNSSPSNPELETKIERLIEKLNNTIPDVDYLQRLSEETSVDFATLYLARSILKAETNQKFYARFIEEQSNLKTHIKNGERYLPPQSDTYIFLFIPGWVYKSEPENGADFAKPREILAAWSSKLSGSNRRNGYGGRECRLSEQRNRPV